MKGDETCRPLVSLNGSRLSVCRKFKGTLRILHGILNSIPTCVEGCQKMAASTNSGSSEQKQKASQSKLSSFFTLEKRYKSVSNLDEEVQPRETTQGPSTSTDSKHRKSGFDPTWLKDFTWLLKTNEDDNSGSGMLCKVCRKHNQRAQRVRQGCAVWVDVPCFNYKRDALKEHEKTNHHNVAVNMEAQLGLTAVDGGIKGALKEVMSAERKAFIGHLKCMYWLIKAEVPHTTNFESLVELCESLGCEYLQNIRKADNAKYSSERFMQEVVEVLGKVVQDEILKEVKASPFFAILADEATVIAVLEQLILYVRYLSGKGTIECSFLGTFELPNCKAQTITDKICSVCNDLDLPLNERMCGFGSDGASTMIGRRNGVAAKLKEIVPWLVNNHCVAHRLALACSQAADAIPFMKKFKDIVSQMHRFYDYSPVRTVGLKEIQSILGASDLRLKRASDTRWLSHDQAITAIRKSLPSIITSLQKEATERNDAQALGLSKFICTYQFVASLYMMSDILPILSHLSRLFQKKSLDFSLIKPLVKSTVTQLEILKTVPGSFFKQVDGVISNELKDFEIRSSSKDDFKHNVYDKYLQNICKHLEDRFPDAGLLEAFSVFDSTNWPSEYLPGDGEEHIKELIKHYQPIVEHQAT